MHTKQIHYSLLNRVDEIRSANYIPNNDDILQSRRRTSDIQKLEFQVNLPNSGRAGGQPTEAQQHVQHNQQIQHHQQHQRTNDQRSAAPHPKQTFCMFDVGGQRGERRKWIQVFDGVSAVMFLIDSSSFDAVDEENGRNKLKETISLFQEVWTTRFLLNSNFVLLFNKQDILREKIERGHKIEDHFPEYKLYKFKPNERHLSEKIASKPGENRLSLFRTISSSSSTARTPFSLTTSSTNSTPARSALSRQSFAASSSSRATSLSEDHSNTVRATKQRKSASLYRFGAGRSRSFFGSKPSKAPAEAPEREQQTPSKHSSQPANSPPRADAQVDTTSPDGSGAVGLEGGHAIGSSCSTGSSSLSSCAGKQVSATSAAAAATSKTSNTDLAETHNPSNTDAQHQADTHLAYIKARSFIRDKFLQVTRQADTCQPHEQRKYSSPNLPIYNQKSTRSAGSASSRVDQPKRNICYHYTTATDTENIRDLFENLQKMVIKSTLKDL